MGASLRYVDVDGQSYVDIAHTGEGKMRPMITDDFPRQFGRRVAAARLAMNLSGDAFGELLGMTKQAVSAWENGRNLPNAQALKSLCEKTGRDANYFIHGEEPLLSAEAIRFALGFDNMDESQKTLMRRMLGDRAPDDRVAHYIKPAPAMVVPQRRRAPRSNKA